MPRKPMEKTSGLAGLWESGLVFFKSLGALEVRVKRSLEKRKTALQGWLIKTVVMSLSVFMSLAFLTLGLFFIVMDYGGVPRGVVFTCGGLLGLVVLGLWFQQQNKKHGD